MESVGTGQGVEQPKNEQAFPVIINAHIAGYLADMLLICYRTDLLGSRNQTDFEVTRRIEGLSERLRPNAEEGQKPVTVNLSRSDIDIIKNTIPLPQDLVKGKDHELMIKEIEDDFQFAKNRAKVGRIIKGVARFVTGRNKKP